MSYKNTILLILGFLLLGPLCVSQAQDEPKTPPVNAVQSPTVDASSGAPLKSETFKLKYISTQAAAEKARELMGAETGEVLVDNGSRELQVKATPITLEKMRALITSLDQEYKVTLEVRVVQVNLSEEHRSGINWSAIVSDYKSFVDSEERRLLSAGTISNEDMDVLLEALETVGETRNFSGTAVTVYSGQDADLRLKALDGVDATVTAIPLLSSGIAKQEGQDRYTARIVMNLAAADNDTVDVRIIPQEGAPVVVRIKKDARGIIGGIFTQTKLESTTKFPFLGDLPVLGVVFRGQSKVAHRLENILILVPKIVANP